MTRASLLLSAIAFAALLAGPAAAQTVVPVAHFTQVQLHGGGEVVLKHGDTQRVTLISGSTQFTTFTIKDGKELDIAACNGSCPHIYDLKIEIVTPDISGVAIFGGGEIKTAGAFPAQDNIAAAIHGGGSIDVRAISAAKVEAAVNGGGDIAVTATSNLMAAVHGGGDITYRGNPAVMQAVAGGGSVSHAD